MAGITPFGFETKSLNTIREEMNAQLVAAIGNGFDTSVDTPQGQMVAVFSDAVSLMWELSQDVYTSFDLRQATGTRLDELGRFRNLPRIFGESDVDYRQRLLAPVNVTQLAVGRIQSAVSAIDGVARVLVAFNDTGVEQNTQLEPLTITISVEGGDDLEVARTISENLAFGLGLTGNTLVNVETANGVCRTIRFTRPEELELEIELITQASSSVGVCSGTSTVVIEQLLRESVEKLTQPGMTLSHEYLKAVLITNGIGVASLLINGAENDVDVGQDQLVVLPEDNLSIILGA